MNKTKLRSMRLTLYFVIILVITGISLYFSETYERKIQKEEALLEQERLEKEEKRIELLEYYRINTHLDSVDLSNLDLKYFPMDILRNLKSLKYLNLSGNKIIEIPYDIFDLKKLEYLNVSHNALTHLSNSGRKSKIKYLLLNNNRIDNSLISGLDSLEVLDMSNNMIRYKYHISNEEYPNLRVLSLSNNQIEIVSGLESLFWLRKVNLSNNQLTEIPIFNEYGSLYYLDLSDNEISGLSYRNMITSVPKTVLLKNNKIEIFEFNSFFQSVKHLDLSNNQISNLGEMYYFDELNYLNLSGNSFNGNINYVDDIAIIDSLDISNNEIANFSWNSAALTYLNLEDNKLIIENCILETNQLAYLNIKNNQVENPDIFNNSILSNLPNLKRINATNTSVCEDKTKSYLNSAIINCE